MSPPDVATLIVFLAGALVLVALNVGLQRLVRPDRGHERIAGSCGTALPAEITDTKEAG